MKNLVIIGPPGSGKDTQVDKLRQLFDFEVISSGDIARVLAEKNEEYRKVVEAGGLLDDSVLTAELNKELDDIPASTGVIFDGYPRNLHQAGLLGEILLHHNRILDFVIYLSLDEAAVVERLSSRRVCSVCGHNVAAEAQKCPICGGEPTRRHDDEPAVIIRRVQTFLENTLPLINYYRNKDILLEVNGDQSIDAVASELREKLGYAGK